MKVLFDVNHAAHVHFIKNAYNILTKEGIECDIVASDKPLAYQLLNEHRLRYFPMGKIGKSLFAKLLRLIYHDLKLLFYCLKSKPDIIIGIVAIRGSHIGWLLRKKVYVFTDTEHAKMQIALFKPFCTEIHTPNWFNKDLGIKQKRYAGFHELAYLHPNHFNPNKKVFKLLGLENDAPYFILRFVAWDATHDINQSGLSLEAKQKLLKVLQDHGRIFISSEYPLEEEFKAFEFKIPSMYLHDALYFAKMVIGEGATTACEAAVLGTPSIYTNSIGLGYIDYLEQDFDLLYHITDEQVLFKKLNELLQNNNLQKEWNDKKSQFLDTQIDTTAYITQRVKCEYK